MDREKVIKGLHDARRYLEDKEWVDRGASPHIDSINDALALLKEQEAVKPQTEKAVYDIGSWWYICGACKKPIDKTDTFCKHCGRPVKRE